MKNIVAFLFCLITAPLFAEVNQSLVTKAENYLNSITGLSGGFVQDAAGKKDSGVFSLLRPGRVRLDYKTIPIQLISNGSNLYFYDGSLDQITTVPLTSTPAGILVRKNIDLVSSDIVVSQTWQSKDSFWLRMNIRDQDWAGFMDVEFSRAPIGLKSWIVHDSTGTQTSVAFQNMKTKTDFAKNYFQLQKMKTTANSSDSFYE